MAIRALVLTEFCLALLTLLGATHQLKLWLMAAVVLCAGFTAIHAAAVMFHRRCPQWLFHVLTNIAGLGQAVYGGVGVIMMCHARNIDKSSASGWQSLQGHFMLLVSISALFVCISGALFARRRHVEFELPKN